MNEINFVPNKLFTERRKRTQKLRYIAVLGISVIIMFCAIYLPILVLNTVERREEARLTSSVNNTTEYTKAKSYKEQAKYNTIHIGHIMKSINSKNIKEVTITNLNFSGSIITIKGLSNEFSNVVKFCNSFKVNKNENESNLMSIEFDCNKCIYNFVFTLKI